MMTRSRAAGVALIVALLLLGAVAAAGMIIRAQRSRAPVDGKRYITSAGPGC